MRYYCITVKNNCGELHAGERFRNATAPLTIGQQASANIKVPCPDDLLPQCFCVIVRNSDNDSWQLIRKSDFYAVKVNEVEIGYICNLKDKDIITIGDHSFAFNTFDDESFIEGQGVIKVSPRFKWRQLLLLCCVLVLVAMLGTTGYLKLMDNRHNFTDSNDKAIRSSVYMIVVDRYLLQRHIKGEPDSLYVTMESYSPIEASVGTCFFTKEGLCVTARHCVEPWLDHSTWSDTTSMRDLPQHVYWAVLAERSQLEKADTLYRIVSNCQVMDGNECICQFTSDLCQFNRSRDIIVKMGKDQLPWRVIYPLYSRKDVELGDFAFIRTNRKGKLKLADASFISSLTKDHEDAKRIYGYPTTNHGNQWTHNDIKHITIPEREGDSFNKCLQLIADGTSGYSGAPVVVKRNGRMTVVGIFSKMDDYDESKNTFYAVPADEISQYNATKANEKKRYRR